MTDHNSKLLSRGLQAKMDDHEDHHKVVEVCLGYAGAVGAMAMDTLATEGERTDVVMGEIVELVSVRKLEHQSHFSFFSSLWTLSSSYLSLHFPFMYCPIDPILPSPLCSSQPIP